MQTVVPQKWEYLVEADTHPATITQVLAARGEEGWELVGAVREADAPGSGPVKTLRSRRSDMFQLFFKRPKADSPGW